jgi:DNA processing protein
MTSTVSRAQRALALLLARPEGGSAARRWARACLADAPGGFADGTRGSVPVAHLEAVERRLASLGWRWTTAEDPDFPAPLAALADPPLGLFVRGRMPSEPAVAVVGARRATAYGREVGDHLGRELVRAGVWVVSGMARGVDAAAHRGALAAGGRTAAVWGAGPDVVYPREHADLAGQIALGGALLTEYPPGTRPLPYHFPERNRLIAGLSQVVVVVEADERSGALVTARLALEEGREVMAVPGSVFSRLSAGPNGLLRAGAAPVLSASDVLAVLGLPALPGGRADEPELLALLPHGESVSVDHLAASSGKPVAELLEVLLQLELQGWLTRDPDGRYRRRQSGPAP